MRDGEWHDEVQRWLDGRIRKVARRARGSKWDAAAALPGVTVVHHGASVRAFVPGPTDAVPPQIAKLQVAGQVVTFLSDHLGFQCCLRMLKRG